MKRSPQIETDRLSLRAITLDDAQDIFSYSQNPNVLRFTAGTSPTHMSETLAFISGLLNKPEGFYAWSIRIRGNSEVIGVIELSFRSGPNEASVDYALAESTWNNGYMTETIIALLKWAFTSFPKLDKIISAAMKTNPASSRVQEKCGMTLVRIEEKNWNKFTTPVQIAFYEITRKDWDR